MTRSRCRCNVSPDLAEQVRAGLPGRGHTVVRANLADAEAVRQMVDQAHADLGGLDVLVNNAGIYLWHPITEVSYEEWQQNWHQILAVNLTGAANVTWCAVQYMRSTGGRIINVTSRGAYRGEPSHPAYGASKAGLNSFGQSMARALAPLGIAVASVAPGYVASDMTSEELATPRGAELRAQSPFGRVAEPEEIAAAVLYLASADAEWASGAVLDLNELYLRLPEPSTGERPRRRDTAAILGGGDPRRSRLRAIRAAGHRTGRRGDVPRDRHARHRRRGPSPLEVFTAHERAGPAVGRSPTWKEPPVGDLMAEPDSTLPAHRRYRPAAAPPRARPGAAGACREPGERPRGARADPGPPSLNVPWVAPTRAPCGFRILDGAGLPRTAQDAAARGRLGLDRWPRLMRRDLPPVGRLSQLPARAGGRRRRRGQRKACHERPGQLGPGGQAAVDHGLVSQAPDPDRPA